MIGSNCSCSLSTSILLDFMPNPKVPTSNYYFSETSGNYSENNLKHKSILYYYVTDL